MKNVSISRSTFWLMLPISLLLLILVFPQLLPSKITAIQKQHLPSDPSNLHENSITLTEDKQKGVHVFGRIDSNSFTPLLRSNIDWITIVTWGYQDDFDSPVIRHNNARDSAQLSGVITNLYNRIALAHDSGFKIFFKPHLWISNPSHRTNRADIFPANEEDWNSWEKNYTDFILSCARIAEETNIEMFCIGTELTRLTKEKPEYWRGLIKDVQNVYTGKITYAANWYEEYEEITFWQDLDFIGIQAYFPLVEKNNPTAEEISKGWTNHLPAIEEVYKKYNKQILFTELGYKSTSDSAIEPWKWVEHSEAQDSLISLETQANCYEAFFNSVWKNNWFAGVHLWQYRGDYVVDKNVANVGFNPWGKPAEKIISKGFK